MKVLHLVGSQTSDYYYGVSALYAPGCIGALPDVEHVILLARLDGTWSVLSSLEEDTIATAKRLNLPKALVEILDDGKPDLMQPHMFCYQGMVTYRSIADMLDIPLLGSPGHVMALTTNKWQTRAVVESAGVSVPKAQLLQEGDDVKMEPPFILKPCREDNSMGISLVTSKDQLQDALKTAFTFDDQILCEQFIPLGREIRVGVVEGVDGKLEMLPTMEYILSGDRQPIRTSADKLVTSSPSDDEEKDDDQSKLSFAQTIRNIPAKNVDEKLMSKLYDLACRAHLALGCEHYSLYDVRVDPSNNPFFIEASPYCSFSPSSAIVVMSRGNPKYNDTDMFYRLAKKAIKDYQPISPSEMNAQDADAGATTATAKKAQQLGMRARRTL